MPFARVVLGGIAIVAALSLAGESIAAPISTAPRPPPSPSPTTLRGERKCGTLSALSHYRFEDSLSDATGVNAPFTPGPVAPTYTTGRLGKAVSFANGATASVKLKAFPAKWTISHWVRQQSKTVANFKSGAPTSSCMTGGDMALSAAVPSRAGMYNFFNVGAYASSGCSINEAYFLVTLKKTPADVGTWMHIAAVFDETTVRVYRDAKEIGTYTPTSLPNVESEWRLGDPLTTTDKYAFDGQIDDLRVYGLALSIGRVTELATGGEPSECK